jgi:hypothetical protein
MTQVSHHSRQQRGCGSRFRRGFQSILLVATAGLLPSLAHADLIDQVDVQRVKEDTEIAIRFSTTVQYERHQPPAEGSLLKIEFQVTGSREQSEGRLLAETRRHPGNKDIPAFEVEYDGRNGFLLVKFARATPYKVGPGTDPRSIRILIPVPPAAARLPDISKPGLAAAPAAAVATPKPPVTSTAAVPVPLPTTPPTAAPQVDDKSAPPGSTPSPATALLPAAPISANPDVEAQAQKLMEDAGKALRENRANEAIDLYDRVLTLPPTTRSQEAQELIGQAREAAGEPAKAKAEYELFLKLFPDTPGAERVKKRLAFLNSPQALTAAGKPLDRSKPEYSVYGSISSYYYTGATKYDATLAPPQPGLTFDRISLTSTDQSSLVTNIDLNGRYRGNGWDNKVVVRDTSSESFLTGTKSYNRLNNAYVEVFNKNYDAFARVGRQSSPGYGVLGRFDGAWLRYGFNPSAKVDLLAGETVEFYTAPKKKFVGAAFDLGPFAGLFSGNVFAVEQKVEGYRDRQAIGSELRYLDPKKNGFALLDYDTSNKVLNIALVQANWTISEATSANMLFDRRRSPTLQLTNGLFAFPFLTVRENINAGSTIEELRAAALGLTPVSTSISLGLTHQYSPAWQFGGDIRYSDVTGTPAVASLPAQASSGKNYVYGLQAIRIGIFTVNDIIVASTNIIRGQTYRGEAYQFTHVGQFSQKWRVESTLKYYQQVDSLQNKLKRTTPSLRVSYRWLERLSIEGEAGAEFSTTDGVLQSDKVRRSYYNLGARYDFY